MRVFKVFGCAMLLLMACSFSASPACDLFRGGLFRTRHRSDEQPQVAAVADPLNGAPVQQWPGSICRIGAQGCGCCEGCPCSAESCPCKIGMEPCSDGCRCLLAAEQARKCETKPAVDPVQFPGIPPEQFAKIGKEERFEINGKRASKRQVIQALSTVPDDRAELSLSFLGGTAEGRAQALALAKELGLDTKTLIQAYDASDPLLQDRGFVVPSTYLQAPGGKVLLRAARMDKPALLAVAAKVAGYDPSKDPAPDAGWTLADIETKLAAVPGWAWFAAALVVLLLYQKKEIKTP